MDKNVIDKIILDRYNREHRNQKDIEFVRGSSLLSDDFGFDSLDVMEIIVECEGIFKKKIPNKDIHDIFTKENIYQLFED